MRLGVVAVVLSCFALISQSNASFVSVPGTADPWLAGMPDGANSGFASDVAPTYSPAQMPAFNFTTGDILHFTVTGGATNSTGSVPIQAPDGYFPLNVTGVAVNGLGTTGAPAAALVGVFLDDNQPNAFTPPAPLSFTTSSSRDFTSLSPQLRQVFFIGDGRRNDFVTVQNFVVPAGATRLFLGAMDGVQWSNNSGTFNVTMLPEPTLLSLGAMTLFALRRRRRC